MHCKNTIIRTIVLLLLLTQPLFSQNIIRIYNRYITPEDLTNEYRKSLLTEEPSTELKQKFIDGLIKKAVLLYEAERVNITVEEESVTALITSVEGRFPDRESFLKALKERGYTLQSYRKELTEGEIITELINSQVKAEATDLEASDYYREHKEQFTREAVYEIAHILLSSKQKGIDLRNEILRGKEFSEAAKEHSLGITAEKGGYLGSFKESEVPPDFLLPLQKIQKGEITLPFQTHMGYHILKLIHKRDKEVLSFSEVKEEIKKRLTASLLQAERNRYVNELIFKADIEILEETW